MKKIQNKKWFSIVFALGLTLLFSFTWLYLLEYMIPFSRNVKGIENSAKAFYQAYSGIEESLYRVNQGDIWNEFSKNFWVWIVEDYSYAVSATWSRIPALWTWNSEEDADSNKLSFAEPIQLVVGSGLLDASSNPIIQFSRYNGWAFQTPNDELIIWQLSSQDDSISTASWNLVTESNISITWHTLPLWTDDGVTLDGTTQDFRDFYTANCGAGLQCVLKISLIHALVSSTSWVIYPYLNYNISFAGATKIPLRFTQLEARWKSYGFSKKLEVVLPQQTTNAAFDFTVFQ